VPRKRYSQREIDAAFARLKKGGWGGLQKIARNQEAIANALMEMDMRGELADSPEEKGVVRIQNRWGPPRKKRKR
jgi:hypothetical protein